MKLELEMKTKTKRKLNCFQNHEEDENTKYFAHLHL